MMILVIVGGLLYTGGAIVYALKQPNPWPGHFGFHEIFHVCTVLAFLCHWTASLIIAMSPPTTRLTRAGQRAVPAGRSSSSDAAAGVRRAVTGSAGLVAGIDRLVVGLGASALRAPRSASSSSLTSAR